MNNNIDLTKILKDCPTGTKFYTPVWGEVVFVEVIESGNNLYPILIFDSINNYIYLTKDGHYLLNRKDSECILFPSKDQRDWSKFTAPWYKNERFDPKTLQPFDKVLVRDSNETELVGDSDETRWRCAFYSHERGNENSSFKYATTDSPYEYCIPYNDDTKHLAGTTDEAPEYYRYWED